MSFKFAESTQHQLPLKSVILGSLMFLASLNERGCHIELINLTFPTKLIDGRMSLRTDILASLMGRRHMAFRSVMLLTSSVRDCHNTYNKENIRE